jgi:tRNA threonylcarbamoyl adenosine modification protein (Sua5/YciO/YrdC/YwlC family)
MLVRLYEENPNEKQVQQVVDCLKNGGVVIFPTDTIYAIGCDIYQRKAFEKIARIKNVKPEKANFSFIFNDLSHLSEYCKHINNSVFKIMRKSLPGPFTFILEAGNKIPKIMQTKKRTIGIRVPDNNITKAIIEKLGNPMISTSIHDDDEIVEYTTDPELIFEKYESQIDMMVNGGPGQNVASTIIDCTNEEPEILREGLGEIDI